MTDSWPLPCHDCGIDTVPTDGKHEFYMVHDNLWAEAGMVDVDEHSYLCIACLE